MLTSQEEKELVKLLKKIDQPNEGLPQPIFDAFAKLVPFVACELVVVNDKNEILLTWREDQFWRGWHFPGGLLRLHEGFEERLQNVARQELGIQLTSFEIIGSLNYANTPRGHDVSLLFLCQTADIPKDGNFFKEMPDDIIPNHKVAWKQVKNFLRFNYK